jgi:menaquinone-dependent protoporphyrinogen IX oxidase
MRVLVVYFSRTGRTQRLAQRLARELGASLMEITESRSRLGLLGYQRSLFEAVAGRSAAIESPLRNPADYDLVLIGTPIWGWHLSSPVRALAHQWRRKVDRVAFFATMGGSGSRQAFDELRRILRCLPSAELALTEREMTDLGAPAVRAKLDQFVKRVAPEVTVQPVRLRAA